MGGRQVNKNQQMNNPLQSLPDEKPNPLAKLFQGKESPYVPVTKSLDDIGLDPLIMDINIDDEKVECLVIPVQDLIYREWRYMTKSELVTKPQNREVEVYDERNQAFPGPTLAGDPEMGGSGDVQGGTN